MAATSDICTVCGQELRPGARFCRLCGTPTIGPATGPEFEQTVPLSSPGNRDTTAAWAGPTETFVPPTETFVPPTAPGPAPGHPGGPGTGPGPAGPRRSSPRSAKVGLLLLAVLIVGVVAYLVTHGKSSSTGTSTAPATDSAATTTATSAVQRTVAPTTTQPPQPSTTLGPSAIVDTAAVSASPLASAVSGTLATYFGGINNKDFAKAYAVLSPANRSRLSYAAFVRGAATSVDSAIAVQSIDTSGGNPVTAVNFTSHQTPNIGPNPGETCTNWSLSYHLVAAPAGAAVSYLIDAVTFVGAGHSAC